MNEVFHRFATRDALTENSVLGREINGLSVAVVLAGGKLSAFVDKCPHAGAKLSGGRVRRGRIFCPLHGAPFSTDDGSCLGAQRYAPLEMLPVRIVDDWIEIAVPEAAAK